MKFNIGYQPAPGAFTINHSDRLLLVGSCFSEHIGQKLKTNFFTALSNPGGNYYSPVAIANFLNSILNLTPPPTNFMVQRDGRMASLEVQNLRGNSKEELLAAITDFRKECHFFLASANVLVITLGTAVAYNYQGLGWVTNNHKQPGHLFQKKRWSVDDCVAVLEEPLKRVLATYPHLQVVFTVSPVKYLSDGLEENSRSKATLLLCAEAVCKHERCHYFPAYELVTDDLRDHRFFESDLIHPNQIAIAYVWEKFVETYMGPATKTALPLLQKYHKALAHRPIHSTIPVNHQHLVELTAQLKALLPHLTLPSLPEKP